MSAAGAEEHWDGAVASGARMYAEGLDTSHQGILYLDGISVSFDGFRALNNLSLLVDVGELRCVIGPNGGGKTTMMDVVTGKTQPDTGSAFFGQTIDLTRLTEAEIAHAGIGRKFQKPTVFERHSVFENLELAMKADKRVGPTLRARLDGEARDRIASTMETIKLLPEARRLAGMLSHGFVLRGENMKKISKRRQAMAPSSNRFALIGGKWGTSQLCVVRSSPIQSLRSLYDATPLINPRRLPENCEITFLFFWFVSLSGHRECPFLIVMLRVSSQKKRVTHTINTTQ